MEPFGELDSPLVDLSDDLGLVLQVLHQLGDPLQLVVVEVEVCEVDGAPLPALLEELSLIVEPLRQVAVVWKQPPGREK